MKTIIEKKPILLNKLQTKEFLYRIDEAMHLFNSEEIFKVILDFKFDITPDIKIFLDQANQITKVSNEEIIVTKVTPFETKCIACYYGKTVKGYEIQSVLKSCKNLGYINKTALYFDIVEDELIDFGWCNAFLSKEEV